MALQKQVVPVQLGQGIDTKTDSKQVVIGKLLSLQNAVLETKKRFTKRNGYKALATLGANCNGMLPYNQDVIAISNNNLIQDYSQDAGQFFEVVGQHPMIYVSSYKGSSTFGNHLACDTAIHSSGIQMVAWTTSSSVEGTNISQFAILDSTTKSQLSTNIIANQTAAPKTVVLGDYLLAFGFSGNQLLAWPVNYSTPSQVGNVINVSNTLDSSHPNYDVVVMGSTAYVSWAKNGGGINCASIDATLSVSSVTTLVGADATGSLTIAADSTLNQLWIAYSSATTVNYTVVSTSFSAILTTTLIETINSVINICAICDNGSGQIFYEVTGAAGPPAGTYFNAFIRIVPCTNTTPGTPKDFKRSVGLSSKPFKAVVNGFSTTCVMVGYAGQNQGYNFVLNTAGVVLAKLGPDGNASGVSGKTQGTLVGGPLPNVTTLSSTDFVVPFLQADFAYGNDSSVVSFFGTQIANLDFSNSFSFQGQTASNDLHVTGGLLFMYDGFVFGEHGYNIIAEAPTSFSNYYDSSTNNFNTGTYSYIVVFEWFDNKGNLHRSTPSPAATHTISGNTTTVNVTVPTLRLTSKPGVIISVFRNTIAQPANFYRVFSTPNPQNATNSDLSDTVNVADSTTDAAIVGHQPLYTTGGVEAAFAVPAPKAIFSYKNRLMVVPSETPTVIWFSKLIEQSVPGSPVEFASDFTIQINTTGGDLVNGIQMDDKAIVFQENSVLYFVGDGPDDTGANNDFSPPQQIASDTGLADGNSLVLTPIGVMFKSPKGIYLLDRSLQMTYIGQDVEKYNSISVTSAVLIPNTTQVRFMLNATTGVNCLVYDYLLNQWSEFTNHSSVNAAVYQNLYTFLMPNGTLLQETPGAYSDNGAYIPMLIQTGWLSFDQLEGFQRIKKFIFLGDYYSAHALNVYLTYDFDPNTLQTTVINPANVLDFSDTWGSGAPWGDDATWGGDYQNYQFRVFTSRQKCEAIQVTIQDVHTTEIGQSFSLSGIAFEVAGKQGVFKLPASQSFG